MQHELQTIQTSLQNGTQPSDALQAVQVGKKKKNKQTAIYMCVCVWTNIQSQNVKISLHNKQRQHTTSSEA